ncbi:MAG: replication restart helicase PriA [Nitrospinota bacterium]
MSKSKFVSVALARPVKTLFVYELFDEMISKAEIGTRLLVDFRNRPTIGVLIDFTGKPNFKTKLVLEIIDKEPYLPDDIFKMSLFASKYYHSSLGELLNLTPIFSQLKIEKLLKLRDPNIKVEGDRQVLDVQAKLREEGGELKLNNLRKKLKIDAKKLDKLIKSDLGQQLFSIRDVVTHSEQSYSINSKKEPIVNNIRKIKLSTIQQEAVEIISADMKSEKFQATLLFGPTGSGKTEIYAKLSSAVLATNSSVLILAPEIAIAEHIQSILTRRVSAPVLIYHSDLTKKERLQVLNLAKNEPVVLVGARSALFLPVHNLKLIVVDEEHDSSFKQEVTPIYNGKDLAIKRAALLNIQVLLGSATPSIESYYNTTIGKYKLIKLKADDQYSAKKTIELVTIEDQQLFSTQLESEIRSRLEKNEQTMLLINRRGSLRYLYCKQCFVLANCRNCSVALVYYSAKGEFRCNFCEYKQGSDLICGECGSENFSFKKIGTEKVEEELKRRFRSAKIERLDRDITSKKGLRAAILEKMKNREIDILVGTEMIAKGHDIQGLTLAGALLADEILAVPDFRSREKSFQLFSQLAGRVGRGQLAGKVIIQSRSNDQKLLELVKNDDYEQFYNQEIVIRKSSNFPPFSRLAVLKIVANSQKSGQEYINRISGIISAYNSKGDLLILGPVEALTFKIRNRYNWRLLLISSSRRELSTEIRTVLKLLESPISDKIQITIDVDPLTIN